MSIRRSTFIPITSALDDKGLDFFGPFLDIEPEHLRNNIAQPIGIENEWSIQFLLAPTVNLNQILLDIIPAAGTRSRIVFANLAGVVQVDVTDLFLFNQKTYRWENRLTADAKTSLLTTWDGTDLLLYVNGVDAGAPDTAVRDDVPVAQAAVDRIFGLGVQGRADFEYYKGLIHSASIWNVVLSPAEITELENGDTPQAVDNRFNFGDYVSSLNLVHYYRLGLDVSESIGKDLGYGTHIDLGQDSRNLDETDIVDYDSTDLDIKSLSFLTDEALENSTTQSIGIANTWSVQCLYEPSALTAEMQPLAIGFSPSLLLVTVRGERPNDPFRIAFRNSAGGQLKNYEFDSVHTVGVKISTLCTWDGTDLLVYIDGVETTATTKGWDFTGSMDDADRALAVGVRTTGTGFFDGKIHSIALWDSVLDSDEVTELENGGTPEAVDNRFNVGNYVSASNLVHYYRLGLDAANLGKDSGIKGPLIDIGVNSVNIDGTDIVDY